MKASAWPRIIQGGMGIGVSHWKLAGTVSRLGQLGVVSGTALNVVMARRLQQGDPGGRLREALTHFPVRMVAARVLKKYYVPGGLEADSAFAGVPMISEKLSRESVELTVLANFVEVHLAKRAADGAPVGLNLLEKIQLPTLPSLYGAMLAGVDYVLMGAGIPLQMPAVLDHLAKGEPAEMRFHVAGETGEKARRLRFSPAEFLGFLPPRLQRPKFLPIISSATLALTLAKKASGRVDGFIVEGSCAGGHNAPPRGPLQLNSRGEPVYGPRDVPDLEKIRSLGLPFWLAGNYHTAARVEEALQQGATGVQVGTPFAFCQESGLDPELRRQVLEKVACGQVDVVTDPLASPTGYPFKLVQIKGSASEDAVAEARRRACNIGLLREPYERGDGSVGYRCPSETVEDFVRKGGEASDACGRKCLCNGLLATVGLGQRFGGGRHEPALVTAGDALSNLSWFLSPLQAGYRAADVLRILLQPTAPPAPAMALTP